MAEMACERLTGQPVPSICTPAMQWGIDTEPLARAAYSMHTNFDVFEIGFVEHPNMEWCGASPDGLINEKSGGLGLVEIKCPNSLTHMKTLKTGSIPKKYMMQMDWQMACTGAKWCDFVSYDPRMPDKLHMFIKRHYRNDDWIETLESDAQVFLDEVKNFVDDMMKYELHHEI